MRGVQTDMHKRSEVRSIVFTILQHMPPEAQISRVEFEGPEIAVYTRNPAIIVKNPSVVREIAKKLKKRIVIRTDPSIRKSKEETKEIILSTVPKEAKIKAIMFDDVLGEVIVKAEKVGLVYGKGRSIYNKVLVETGWRLNVVRAAPRDSVTLNKIIDYMLSQSMYRLSFLRSVGERIHRGVIFENRYVRITALGGFMEVGRSAILVETPESRVLLDLGINPGGVGYTRFPRIDIDQLRLDELDAVVVTHAHLDHMGLVPFLFKYGYKGPVYATKPTRDLMVLSQLDLLDITQREGSRPPYSQLEVKKMILHTIPLDYGEVTDIAPDIKLTFYNAGHILGSAMAHLHIGEGLHNIVYTGDFKYDRTKLLDKAHDSFPRVETLIMETTYGTTVQKKRSDAEKELINHILSTMLKGGKVLIPVMAVGRAQEILLVIADYIRQKKLDKITIYIDGMIDEVTAIHLSYPELLSSQLQQRIFNGENPFEDEFIVKVENRQMREDIVKDKEPCVILATSGMLQGGPSVEYLYMMAEDPRNKLLFVSYQVKGTLGRQIKDGAREITMISPEGKLEVVKIKMEVESVEGFSGHSDRTQLLRFLKNMKPKPKRIILAHGEPNVIREFAQSLQKSLPKLGYASDTEVLVPSVLDSIYVSGIA